MTYPLPPDLARGVFEAAPDAMIVVDQFGVIRFANARVTALFGYGVDEVVGQRVEHLVPSRFRERHRQHRAQYSFNERVRPMGAGLALSGRRRDGSEFPVEISLSPIGNADESLVAAAIRDVSDRKLAEQELLDARRHADMARHSADRANQAKSRFLATASHDLRQPLQVLALLNGMLLRKVQDPDAREAVTQQEQAVGAMSRLVNALLDVSKLESGAIKPDPSDFAVTALFEELRREFSGLALQKGLRLEVDQTQDCVRSDRSLVGQVLRNLLANAIKYTRSGWVALRCLAVAGKVRVEVLDTGIGIPPAQLPYIYDEFFQVEAADGRAREGYGLGLSIVRRIVALLDLKLEVHSEPGKGSCFTIELPAASSAAAVAARIAAPSCAQRLAGMHVLLVDDDERIRSAAQILLELEGCRVRAAASLAEALAGSDPVDLVLADYHLGGGETGVDVIEALRARLGEKLPAVLLTGDTSNGVKEMAAAHSFQIASKPIDSEELFSLLDDLRESQPAITRRTTPQPDPAAWAPRAVDASRPLPALP
jgi:PAS domain S-box-containing protein